MVGLSIDEKIEFFQGSAFLKGAKPETLADLAKVTREVCYPKGTVIARDGMYAHEVFIVSCGLLRVSAISESGKRITFILAKKGEPYNILSPFMKGPRHFMAEAVKNTRCLQLSGPQYLEFIESHPDILIQIISWIAPALDSAISRIFDQMEKKVECRIMRVLRTLSAKFGSPLFFTNAELAELAGTTTESAIRAMAVLRELRAIETQRGRIWVKDPDLLKKEGEMDIRI
ncbi:Crp/Fnr family transcriptional regulator [Desulforhopalus singaporensis]|uniref:cAMP-binding domain of CRP or a regulatory subunit of cAMP-dependent protein kinases n=1 Tax=Desulforhopalus singaporensis TaxID=91360 RepID=A0A1H0VV52_9BACT|nr:Crp/Fnr family transcriptional regulator [Desulforhopalus singaporensis]SDP82462.1 cAMP-binding domain of CRP or a regulatory subunit of cAMP-dependent protein kinases [Desulforhopalus singaporensis]